MKQMLTVISGVLLAVAPHPAAAQDAASASTVVPLAPVDPARLAAAKITVDHIFPQGTYARIMNGSMSGMIDSIAKSSTQIPLRELAGIAGTPPEDLAKLGGATLADIMAILDPAHDQRMSILTHTTMTAMSKLMSQLEPSIRDGLAEAYARRFSAAQLADMNRFFDTPSGQAYAANAMIVATDPAVMSRMQAIVPTLLKQLPEIMSQVSQATAKLPPIRKFADLSPAERAKLAGLLGVSEAQLETNASAKN